MKKLIAIIILTFICNYSKSQSLDTNYYKFSVGVFGSTPIHLSEMDEFFDDHWHFYGSKSATFQKRRDFKYGCGINLQYFLNHRVSIKGLFGISHRYITENYSALRSPSVTSDYYYNYKQTSYNFLVGVNLSLNIKKFVINSGLELAYLRSGIGNETRVQNEVSTLLPDIKDSSNNTYNSKISPGNSYGLGINLGIEYYISNHLTIGAEFHEIAFYSVFNGNSSTNLKEYYSSFTSPDLTITQSETNTDIKENLRQFSVSTILPVLTINYKFNSR